MTADYLDLTKLGGLEAPALDLRVYRKVYLHGDIAVIDAVTPKDARSFFSPSKPLIKSLPTPPFGLQPPAAITALLNPIANDRADAPIATFFMASSPEIIRG
jgi:hypothetical protein